MDLKSCQQEPSESLRDYIRRFSQRCNSLPNVVDADIINAFLSRTNCESLMDEGSGLNILYVDTLDAMHIPQSSSTQ